MILIFGCSIIYLMIFLHQAMHFLSSLKSLQIKIQKLLAGDLSILDLEENAVVIYSRWDDEKRILTVNRAYLLELAKKWRGLCELDVPIITIKRENAIFIIEQGKEV